MTTKNCLIPVSSPPERSPNRGFSRQERRQGPDSCNHHAEHAGLRFGHLILPAPFPQFPRARSYRHKHSCTPLGALHELMARAPSAAPTSPATSAIPNFARGLGERRMARDADHADDLRGPLGRGQKAGCR